MYAINAILWSDFGHSLVLWRNVDMRPNLYENECSSDDILMYFDEKIAVSEVKNIVRPHFRPLFPQKLWKKVIFFRKIEKIQKLALCLQKIELLIFKGVWRAIQRKEKNQKKSDVKKVLSVWKFNAPKIVLGGRRWGIWSVRWKGLVQY